MVKNVNVLQKKNPYKKFCSNISLVNFSKKKNGKGKKLVTFPHI